MYLNEYFYIFNIKSSSLIVGVPRQQEEQTADLCPVQEGGSQGGDELKEKWLEGN